MIRITSNIKESIARLQRLEAGIPTAMQTAMDPQRWEGPLTRAAVMALEAIATPEERPLIPGFVQPMTVAAITGGFAAELGHADKIPNMTDVMRRWDAGMLLQASTGQAKGQQFEFADADMADVRKLVEEWVRQEKDKTEEDLDIGDDAVTDRVMGILFPGPDDDVDDKSRAGLVRAITWWAFSGNRQTPLNPARASQWLVAVLAAWVNLVRTNLRLNFRAELHKLWG